MKISTVRINSKGQITIPSFIRKQLKLESGDEINLQVDDKKIIAFPKQGDIKAAFALIKAKVSVSIEDMEKAIRNRASHDCG
jgi:AbrB family looped-hinge helix DNA binding protein